MGLLSWLFPSAKDRVRAARRKMQAERWAEARLELLGVEHPDVPELLAACELELARLNLEAAVSWCRAADDARVLQHLELAEGFAAGRLDDAVRDARREMRAIRQQRTVQEERRREAEQARLLAADPFGNSGGPAWRDPTLPADFFDGDDDEAAARLALVVEGYDAALRSTVGALGGSFARALLDFEDGRPDLALQALLALPDDSAVVRFERARTAYALGDARAAARELRAFARLHGQHTQMGRHHTGSFLALCLAESGDPAEALRVMRDARRTAPQLDGALFAQLLLANERLDEADRTLVGLLRTYPRDNGLYLLLAQVRLRAEQRMGAMQVLERAMTATHTCTPGQCGYQPPDVRVLRTLATLYLEDGIELDRARELADQARALVTEPTWEDAYLVALCADRSGTPEAEGMVKGLWASTPPGDARHARIDRYLPEPA